MTERQRGVRLGLLPFLLLPAAAHGQMGRTFPTIEALVGEAAVVVRGHFISVENIELAPRGGTYDKTNWPDGWYRTVSTVKVDEAIKGGSPSTFRVLRESHGLDRQYDNWMAYGAQILFFLPQKPGLEPLKEWGMFRMAPVSHLEPAFYGSDWTAIGSMDLTVLQSADQILPKARDFAKKHPAKVETVMIETMSFQAPHLPPPADANAVILPLVPELREFARTLAASKDAYRREQGRRILKRLGS